MPGGWWYKFICILEMRVPSPIPTLRPMFPSSLQWHCLPVLWCLALTPALAGKYSSGGGRSYSSGSSSAPSRPSAPSSSSSNRPSSNSFNSTRSSYSSNSAPSSSWSNAAKPAPQPVKSQSSLDNAAAKSRQVDESKRNFVQSTLPPPPRTTYTSRSNAPNVSSFNTPPAPRPQSRMLTGYRDRPLVIYHDSYSSPFWWWLLDQPRPVRAMWIYHHSSSIDPARQAALIAADPPLQESVQTLATTTPPVDPNYTPPGLETPEEMTTAPIPEVTSTPLPVPMQVNHFTSTPVMRGQASSGFPIFIFLAGISTLIWLVFFKRWKFSAT